MGYYGFGNAGDEHLLKQTLRYFHIKKPYILPKNRWASLWHMAKYIPKSQVVIFGGGSIFQDISSKFSLMYYLVILSWALFTKRATYLIGHGIGPIQTGWLKTWMSFLLPHIDVIVARDTLAYTAFLKLGSAQDRTYLGTDLAFFFGAKEDLWQQEGQLAISVKGLIPPILLKSLRETVQPGLLWIALQTGYDQILSPGYTLNDALALPETFQFRGCIAMRYHACVWATLHGIPFLAVGSDPKLHALATELRQPHTTVGDTLSEEIREFQKNLIPHRVTLLRQRELLLKRLPNLRHTQPTHSDF